MMRKLQILISLFTLMLAAQAQQPAAKQSKSVLLLNATAHLGNGEVIRRAAIGFRDGKIDMVYAAIDIRTDTNRYDTIIHLDGKHIYPGFIAPNSRLGLAEIGAVRASNDYREVGEFKPHVRSLTAYYTDSKVIPTVRTNGVLIAQVTPTGGWITGTSSVFQLEGWNWEDAVLKADDGIHLNWPSRKIKRGWWAEPKADEKNKAYQEQVSKIKAFFERAQAYQKESYHLDQNIRLEAMKGLFGDSATSRLYIRVNEAIEITDAIHFATSFGIEHISLVGAYDAWRVADLLKDNNVSVILRRVHELPMREDDPIDLPFLLPKKLADQGILFCLENSGSMEAMGTRNLPFYAGTAVAFGLDKETALQAITLNTAKILGIDEQVGSIAVGKDATLFVSDGDALEMRSNQVSLAYVQGKCLDLDNRQKRLYRTFKKKYQESAP